MAKPKQETIGDLINLMARKKAEIDKHQAAKKRAEEEFEAIKARFMLRVDGEGITSGRGATMMATVTERTVPQVVDWDKFYGYIHEHRFYHLLHRRPSSVGCNEQFEAGTDIPGVEKFRKRDVSLRSL